MSDYTGMSMDRELARIRHAELLEEAANMRADRMQGSTQAARVVWLTVSLIGLVLVAGAAWVLILG